VTSCLRARFPRYRCVRPALLEKAEESLFCGRRNAFGNRDRNFFRSNAFRPFGIYGRHVVRIRLARLGGCVCKFRAHIDSLRQFDGSAGLRFAVDVVPRNRGFAGNPADRYGMGNFRQLPNGGKPSAHLLNPGKQGAPPPMLGKPTAHLSAPGEERQRRQRTHAKTAQKPRGVEGLSHSESRTGTKCHIRFAQLTSWPRSLVDGRGFNPRPPRCERWVKSSKAQWCNHLAIRDATPKGQLGQTAIREAGLFCRFPVGCRSRA
jgi:hypothetical protein